MSAINDAVCDRCSHNAVGSDKPARVSLFMKHGISKVVAVSYVYSVTAANTKILIVVLSIQFPPLLIIRLERVTYGFDGSQIKNGTFVQFPIELDLRDLVFYRTMLMKPSTFVDTDRSKSSAHIGCDSDSNGSHNLPESFNSSAESGPSLWNHSIGDVSNYRYELCSVVVHCGRPASGHFIAYRRGNGINRSTWYYISDCNIRAAHIDEVLSSEAYMLFYQRLPSFNIRK